MNKHYRHTRMGQGRAFLQEVFPFAALSAGNILPVFALNWSFWSNLERIKAGIFPSTYNKRIVRGVLVGSSGMLDLRDFFSSGTWSQ